MLPAVVLAVEVVVVVVAAVPGELCARQTPDRPQVSATVARIRVLMAAELEEFSTG